MSVLTDCKCLPLCDLRTFSSDGLDSRSQQQPKQQPWVAQLQWIIKEHRTLSYRSCKQKHQCLNAHNHPGRLNIPLLPQIASCSHNCSAIWKGALAPLKQQNKTLKPVNFMLRHAGAQHVDTISMPSSVNTQACRCSTGHFLFGQYSKLLFTHSFLWSQGVLNFWSFLWYCTQKKYWLS